MSENTLTDARRTDGGPPAPPARPAGEVKLVELRKLRLERVILVGVAVDGSVEQAERSVEELHRLAETAGAEVLDAMVQRRARPDAGTFIGKGKSKELAETVTALGADAVLMDDALSRDGARVRHRRRGGRADPRAAAPPGGAGGRQGNRPSGADPRHLRPARHQP